MIARRLTIRVWARSSPWPHLALAGAETSWRRAPVTLIISERAMQVLRDRPAHLLELLMVMVMRVHEAGGEVCPRLCWLANGITAGLRPARQL
jgi:hypothetical protein